MKKPLEIKLDRRSFLKTTTTGVAGLSILSNCTSAITTWRFFTEEEARVIVAMAEQIIPADEDSGATDANVINFIDRQLVSYFKADQELYRKGIAGVQEFSQTRHGKGFEELSWEEQLRLLVELEKGTAEGDSWGDIDPAHFFSTVRNHSMMGFYGPPRHGGNRDLVSYRMVGLDYPQVIGRNKHS